MQAPIFFFATCGTADAQRDDEVSGDLTICIDCQVSAAVVGRQPCLAGRIAELRETRQKRSVRCRRHADFKEVCKYQRLAGVCHIDCGRDCKHGFDAAAVSKQQIQLDDDITGDADVLRPEDRGTHTFNPNQMIISKNPQFTGISARQQLEFTTHLLLTD